MVPILGQVAYILFVVIKLKTNQVSLKSHVHKTAGDLQRPAKTILFPHNQSDVAVPKMTKSSYEKHISISLPLVLEGFF